MQKQQDVGNDLGVYGQNLQIVKGKPKSLSQVIKRSCDFMEGSFSLYVTTLPGVTIVTVAVEIKCF